MTKEEKLTMLQSICGDPEATSEMLGTYLDLAADVIVHKAYPFLTTYILAEVPPQYDTLQVQIANEMYLKRGAEGEQGHSENGVVRSYENGSVSDSLLKQIVPYTRMLNERIPVDAELNAAVITLLRVGRTAQIIAATVVTFNDKSTKEVDEGYRYESPDTSVATVDADGLVTAKGVGYVYILVTGKKSGLSKELYIEVTA